MRRGPNSGSRFLLDSDVTTVGRHPEADIFLDDVTVSRRHAEFLRHGSSFEVKDLGSLNGTYFDGVRIETALLSDGAEVQVGKFRLTFYASRLDLAHLAAVVARASAQAKDAWGATPLLSIGQVLAKLNPEFPDLTPSKLRFLEERQLVAPARTESGYRKFSPIDLDRLRFVLTMQRDHYLPLKVIRGYLDDLDAGRTPTLPGGATPGPSMLSSERKFKRDELIREAGANAMLLGDAISASLIMPADLFGEDALAVLKSLVELQRSGIEPRHLRGFRRRPSVSSA